MPAALRRNLEKETPIWEHSQHAGETNSSVTHERKTTACRSIDPSISLSLLPPLDRSIDQPSPPPHHVADPFMSEEALNPAI